MKKTIFLSLAIALLVTATAVVRAHEKVKLTGYVVDVVCFADHVKDSPEAATKVAAEHTKECSLMEECVKRQRQRTGESRLREDRQEGSHQNDRRGDEARRQDSRPEDHRSGIAPRFHHAFEGTVAKIRRRPREERVFVGNAREDVISIVQTSTRGDDACDRLPSIVYGLRQSCLTAQSSSA